MAIPSMEILRKERSKSISHALDVLNEAAKDSSDEVKEMITTDVRRIKAAFEDLKPEVKGAIRELRDASATTIDQAKEKVLESAQAAARKVDTSAHENPWRYVGGTALLAALTGFILGRKSKH